jgi:hypothetical protein
MAALHSPYTSWAGDELHGRHPVLTPVWIRLDAAYPRPPGTPARTVAHGLDLTGTVPGHLHGWFPTLAGDWLGVCNFDIPYADGRAPGLRVTDQLIPAHALRRRTPR